MNNNEQEIMNSIPGRAPVDEIWDRIEKQLEKKARHKKGMPSWSYTVAIVFASLVMGVVISGFFAG